MKNKKFFLFALFSSLLLSGCGNKENQGTIEVTDMIGRKVSINPGSYKKVVCIGAGALRLYSYIGDISLLSGVEDIENENVNDRPKVFDGVARPYFIAYKDEFKKLPSCGKGGPQAQTIESEKILTCEPDIIISEYEDVSKANALQEQVGVPVITLKYGTKTVFDESYKDSISLLGQIFKKEERAKELNNFVKKETDAIKEKTSSIDDVSKSKVYIGGLGNWATTNELTTCQNYEPFNVANIKNVLTDLTNTAVGPIEPEKYVSIQDNIDKMILDSAAIKNIKGNAENIDRIKGSKAWTNNEVYLQMAYNAYHTNIEIALINTWYNASVVYPEKFNGFNIDSKTKEVTEKFLGKDLTNTIKEYPNSFGGYQKISTTFFN